MEGILWQLEQDSSLPVLILKGESSKTENENLMLLQLVLWLEKAQKDFEAKPFCMFKPTKAKRGRIAKITVQSAFIFPSRRQCRMFCMYWQEE